MSKRPTAETQRIAGMIRNLLAGWRASATKGDIPFDDLIGRERAVDVILKTIGASIPHISPQRFEKVLHAAIAEGTARVCDTGDTMVARVGEPVMTDRGLKIEYANGQSFYVRCEEGPDALPRDYSAAAFVDEPGTWQEND